MLKLYLRSFISVAGFLAGAAIISGAQETIPAAGGTANGQGGSVSFTVGQVIYTAISGQEHTVSQGVQQSFEISVVTSSDEILLSGIDVQAYPNPATDFITLRVESALNKQFQQLAYELFDMTGRVLEKKTISSDHTNIPMGHLAPATYFVKVYHSAKTISLMQSSSVQTKTFKIIKK